MHTLASRSCQLAVPHSPVNSACSGEAEHWKRSTRHRIRQSSTASELAHRYGAYSRTSERSRALLPRLKFGTARVRTRRCGNLQGEAEDGEDGDAAEAERDGEQRGEVHARAAHLLSRLCVVLAEPLLRRVALHRATTLSPSSQAHSHKNSPHHPAAEMTRACSPRLPMEAVPCRNMYTAIASAEVMHRCVVYPGYQAIRADCERTCGQR